MASLPRILVISGLQTASPLWGSSFTQRLSVFLEANPVMAIQRWAEILPDMVVLETDSESLAINLIAQLRHEAIIPILLVSSICSDKFILEVYQAGVDEYIDKLIHPALFHAKLKAWLRHSWNIPNSMLNSLKIKNVELIPSERNILFTDRDPVHLTNLELRLLYFLLGRPGRVVTTEELCQRIWGESGEGNIIRLKNIVYRLRRKIEVDPAHPDYLLTVAGVGYQFKEK